MIPEDINQRFPCRFVREKKGKLFPSSFSNLFVQDFWAPLSIFYYSLTHKFLLYYKYNYFFKLRNQDSIIILNFLEDDF